MAYLNDDYAGSEDLKTSTRLVWSTDRERIAILRSQP